MSDEDKRVRHIPQPEGGRIETGTVQFGDDWPGLFIRGDNALYYALNLRQFLAKALFEEPLVVMVVKGLLDELEATRIT